MNSVKSQDTKWTCGNVWHWYTLIMNYWKEIKKNPKQLIYYCIKKIPKNESNQGGERPVHRKLRHW